MSKSRTRQVVEIERVQPDGTIIIKEGYQPSASANIKPQHPPKTVSNVQPPPKNSSSKKSAD